MVVTAFLGIGPTEILVVVVLFLVFFGVEKVPDIARTLGRLQGEWSRARREVERELKTEEERRRDDLARFERLREKQVRASLPEAQEEARLRNAADALGLETEGRSVDELREDIRRATENPSP